MLPNRIGRYEVLGQLATGGMAEILLARLSGPSDFKRAVVIKRILRQYAQTSSFVAMFLDEARTIASIRHPNVVQVQDLGEDGGDVFLVLEYVAGENLSSVLRRATSEGKRLEPALVAHVIAEACAGLHAAHELVSESGQHQNLVHRDVSPQNIFVAYDGHVKLLDFGVALTEGRLARTEAGDVKGKFEYMSPEQANGERLDRRSDIFAMGIVLYELGTGRRLFKRASANRALEAIMKEPVIPPSRLVDGFPPALELATMRALAKKPEDRYATAAEMRKDLLEIARSVTSPVESMAEHMQRWFPKRIAEKEELLRKVRDGAEVTRVPSAEVDENVRIPQVPDHPAPVPVPVPVNVPVPVPVPEVPRRLGLVLTAITALAMVATATALASRSSSPPSARADDSLASAPPTALPTVLPTPTAIPTAPPSASASAPDPEILVHVESRPPGAHVLTDGADRGITPLDLHVVRGQAPILLELRSPGFASTSQSVVPDADQKLLLALEPLGKPGARPPRPPPVPPTPPVKPPPSSSSPPSGFRRFD